MPFISVNKIVWFGLAAPLGGHQVENSSCLEVPPAWQINNAPGHIHPYNRLSPHFGETLNHERRCPMLVKIKTFGLPVIVEPTVKIVIRGSDYVWVLV